MDKYVKRISDTELRKFCVELAFEYIDSNFVDDVIDDAEKLRNYIRGVFTPFSKKQEAQS